MPPNEELDVFNTKEVVQGIGTPSKMVSWAEEEEEVNPVEVTNGLVFICDSMIRYFKGLEYRDWDWSDPVRRRVLICVYCEMLSQAIVKFAHIVVPGFVGGQGYKYLANQPKVLLHGPFLDVKPY